MIHIAGPAITCSSHRRQRCSWCGTIIEDVDLSMIAMPICGGGKTCHRHAGHDGEHGERQEGDFALAVWPFEALLDIEGDNPKMTSLVKPELHEDGTVKIPSGSCMSLPPEVTQ
ncbi:MAG: hypothetical protein KGL39_57850 [Patescibacteria group bacterium]|nr:hypothetical protein [Patescibacteria group bacterium]